MSIHFELGRAKTDLATLPEKMLEYAFEVLLAQAELMKGYAQVFVPVETGSLRDSIRIERGGEGKQWRTVKVRAGGYVTNPKTGKLVDYAAFVEERFAFMRAAWIEVQGTIADMIKSQVVERVNE